MPVIPSLLQNSAIRLMELIRRTHAREILPGLLDSQYLSLDELEKQQSTNLAQLSAFCLAEVPYYQELLAAADISQSQPLTHQNLSRLPLMTKDLIRDHGEQLKAKSFSSWQPRPKSTSGSTGQPLNYFLDRPSHSFQWAHLWRGWEQTGFKPGQPYATLSGGSLIPEKVDFKQKVYLALNNALHFPSYHLTEEVMAGYLSILEQRSIPFLYGYPSSVELFAEFILASRGNAPLKAVFTTSESLKPTSRQTIEEAFECQVLDTYGCNDGGLYSFECTHQTGFHVGMESVVVEITDDQGVPLPEGEVGQIVTTNLAIRAMPLLRYKTGDIGAIDRQPCSCGRGLLRIVNLQGRERDFVLTPAGRKVHGAFFNHFQPFYDAQWLKQFQIYQPCQETLVVRLVVWKDPSADELQLLTKELEMGLGKMDFRMEIVDSIELTRTGKFRIVISDLT